MLNKKVVAGSLSLALLAAPSLFGLEVASAAAYSKAKKSSHSSPSFTISGAVNAAVRHVDTGFGDCETCYGYGGRDSTNVLVGQTYSDDEYSHIQATAKASSGQFKLTGVLRLAARTNGFGRYTQDNEFVASSFGTTTNGQDEDVYVRAADVRLKHNTFGELRIGKASTATGESTKASFAKTGYLRGDVTNTYNVRVGITNAGSAAALKTSTNHWDTSGGSFGLYGLNYSQNRIEYSAPEFFKGLRLSTEYVSQSDVDSSLTGTTSNATNFPKFDSHGYAVSYKGSMSGMDFDLRGGYTSRAFEPGYRGGASFSIDPAQAKWHLRGTGASVAAKYMGFDGSFAYSKLSPKGLNGNLNLLGVAQTDNSANAAATFNYGHKAAVLTAYELGYSFDLPEVGPLHINGEMSESKDYRNDGSKSTLSGVRVAHDMGPVRLTASYHNQSFKGFKVKRFDSAGTFAAPSDVKTFIFGAYYKF